MDLNGVTWVGNFYQKFEAMCLEVEEIMYQDTVKYVENQVQTVGAGVKKFYSDVMEDLLPPTSMDPEKGAVSDLPIEHYADVGVYMKPKIGTKGKHVKTCDIDQLTKDRKIMSDNNLDHPPTFDGLCYLDNLCPLSQGAVEKYGNGSLSNKSNLGINKNSRMENLPPNEASSVRIPGAKDLITVSSVFELPNENHEASINEKARTATSGSVEVTGHDKMEESKNEIENASEHEPEFSTHEPLSNMVNLVEACWSERMDTKHSSCSSIFVESSDADDCMNNGVVSFIECSQSSSFAEEELVTNSDGWSMDVNMDETLIEQEMTIIPEVDNAKLEETCVMVNGDAFQFIPQSEGKKSPYKNKIRDVFSSRMRSTRKQEYEQLAVRYGDDSKSNEEQGGKNSMPSLLMDTRRSPTHEMCESEWELV